MVGVLGYVLLLPVVSALRANVVATGDSHMIDERKEHLLLTAPEEMLDLLLVWAGGEPARMLFLPVLGGADDPPASPNAMLRIGRSISDARAGESTLGVLITGLLGTPNDRMLLGEL
jgi:hypothetical protein